MVGSGSLMVVARPSIGGYLAQFLSDPRVVELPDWLWEPILHGIVQPLRSRASAKKYESVWLADGSPLRVYTEQQAYALESWFRERGEDILVEYAMRYGSPSITDAFALLQVKGAKRIVLMPMYPQFAASTTATAFDDAARALTRIRNQPEIRLVKQFYDDPRYITSLRKQVEQFWALHGRPDFEAGDPLVLSFHGLPARSAELGDPYHQQCLETGLLLRTALALNEKNCQTTFQSQFGYQEWLQSHTDGVLAGLGTIGAGRVNVFCPGFTADCIETIEEIGMEGRDIFVKYGGLEFHQIDCVMHRLAS
ncbi:ferrochelatase [Paraburkholderia sp. FT54]|uniref:ferrochelatase n=1 Tax=Paraburkholderia sp. FT54 TaxID=3074437 RepID=UPI002877739C|nr:ferrochelatase [Paraburkholderia sp. FT54]WNC95097.1 ferrochelatase [Paraburkholderia sp. FT54]